MHDALTGLPNRGYLRDRLERALGLLRARPATQVRAAVPRPRPLQGDQRQPRPPRRRRVLQEVAQRLQACVREPDVVARLAGDEFAILLEDVPVPETAVRVAAARAGDARRSRCGSPARSSNPRPASASPSPMRATSSADELLRDADVALYRAKAPGRKRFELFDESLQKHAIDVLDDGARPARGAAARPVRALLPADRAPGRRRRCVGYEALMRWNHPERGLLRRASSCASPRTAAASRRSTG